MPAARSKRPATETLSARQQVTRLAGLRATQQAFAWFQKHEEEFSQLQLELSAIPSPPFGEGARAAWLKKRFTDLGLAQPQIDKAGNVIGIRKGSGSGSDAARLAVLAHIDTVFSEGTPLKFRRQAGKLYGPGISDNGSGLVALLAVAQALRRAEVQHSADIVFAGTVGEEGEGNLRGVRHFFSQPEWRESIAYTLVVDGAGTETVVSQALGSRRFEITLRGKGGHSWSDFGDPNPIAVLARAIANLYKTEVLSTARKKSAYNVGVIEGGTSVNSIPESARMRVDLRSESQDELDRLERELRAAIARALSSSGKRSPERENGAGKRAPASASESEAGSALECDIRCIGERPAAELAAEAKMLQVIHAVDAHLGINSRIHCSSTDANIPLSLGKEALSIGAGGTGGGAHTLNEWYDPRGRDLGLKRILLTVLTLAGVDE